MKKQYILSLLLFMYSFTAYTQDIFINADFVSSYMWRGMKCGNAAVQPTLGITMGGFTLSAWGSTEFRNENNEIDLTLEYQFKRLTLNVTNYFEQSEEEPFDYFNYAAHSSGHTFEAGAGYTISEKFPLTASWYTVFAGNDYREDGKRAWSSYCEFSYPFSLKGFDLSVEAGFTPWEGEYADKFNVNNIALSISREIQFSNRFSFPIFGKLGFNPYESTAYFVFGISL